MRVVGVTGRAGSGKDTVADILVRDHGFVKVSFADPLKRICRDVFAFTDEQLWGPSEKRNAPDERYPRWPAGAVEGSVPKYLTPRYALQKLGTEWGRDCFDDVWVNYALAIAAQLLGESGCRWRYSARRGVEIAPLTSQVSAGGVVIPDVRFPNEVAAIRKAGGALWMTTRGEGLAGAAGTHESERHVGGFYPDRTFPSDVTLEALPGFVAKSLSEEVFR